jgi:hypothetical protein
MRVSADRTAMGPLADVIRLRRRGVTREMRGDRIATPVRGVTPRDGWLGGSPPVDHRFCSSSTSNSRARWSEECHGSFVAEAETSLGSSSKWA